MRRRITWRSAAAISMLGLAPGIGAAFAAPAGASTLARASTNECGGAVGGQCGTFTASKYDAHPKGGASGGLGWDVKGQSTASNTPLILYPNYSPGTDPGTDLTKVEHHGAIPGSPSSSPGIWYSIVYTPSGKWTSMCLSNPDNKGRDGKNLVLRSCNQSVWQAFIAVAPTEARRMSPMPTPTLTPGPPPPPPHQRKVLPPAPSAPSWRTSKVIPNPSSDDAYALYSVANGRFVEVTRPHMDAAGPGPGPGPELRALSATGRTGEEATDSNTWFWTNASGTGARR